MASIPVSPVNPAHRNPLTCPHCYSKRIIRYGTLAFRRQTVQRFRCGACKRTFTDKDTRRRSYPLRTILASITSYNTGRTLAGASRETARRHHTRVPLSTLHNWLQGYNHVCTFGRLRQQALRASRNQPLVLTRKLFHSQPYLYQLHRAKLALQAGELAPHNHASLTAYLDAVPTRAFPHALFTQQAPRISQIRFPLNSPRQLAKTNNANLLASLALEFAGANRERHQAIQDFFLANDSCTVAAEVPVYLTEDDIRQYRRSGFSFSLPRLRQGAPLTGHIDLLQVRNGLIRILDYKPEAAKQQPLHQLTAYALALASRTRLPLKRFSCTWFDDRHYFEFFPLQAVYA